jgi:ribonuclease J
MSSKIRLIYLPLGGAGEIGMNMYLYGYGPKGKERFILVDVGVTFPDMESTPGVDLIFADPEYIIQRADRLDGIFITHAHEDHVGGIGHLYGRLGAPIYARRFTAIVARAKMEENGQDMDQVIDVAAWPDKIKAGPFEVAFMPVAHSIPEASGLVIDTPAGRIVHTGDFKLDADPIVGDPYDPVLMREIASGGVQALVCDSTNVFSPEPGRSEASLPDELTTLIKSASGMVVATTFASNIARLKTLAEAGVAAGRSVLVLGRSMQRMLRYGDQSGVLDDFPPTIDLDDARDVPRGRLMLLVTGSQGERRAASGQLANGKYLGFTMNEGDTFLFSSKTIPGNEKSVGRIINAFSEQGVVVVDDSSGKYHVSGHANRPDLVTMHSLMQPKMVIPMHGEHRHLREHAMLAREGRLYLDGTRKIGAMDGVVRERLRMAIRGLVGVSLVIEGPSVIGVWAEPMGLPDGGLLDAGLADVLETEVERALSKASKKTLRDDDAVEDLTHRTVTKFCRDLTGKKPVTQIMINRLE